MTMSGTCPTLSVIMKEKDPLGHLEQLVLTAVMAMGDNAYPVAIWRAACELDERKLSDGSIYITLDRLEDKGYLSSKLGSPTAQRGGRPKRYYRIRAAGERALQESFQSTDRMKEKTQSLWQFIKEKVQESGEKPLGEPID